LYFDEWADEAVISDRATIQIDWIDDGDVLTELNIDNSSMPDLGPRHVGLPQCLELASVLAQE
jgi:hypothetical protein